MFPISVYLYFNAPSAVGVGRDHNASEDHAALRLTASQLMNISRINPDLLDGDARISALVGEVPEEFSAVVRGIAAKIHGQGVGGSP